MTILWLKWMVLPGTSTRFLVIFWGSHFVFTSCAHWNLISLECYARHFHVVAEENHAKSYNIFICSLLIYVERIVPRHKCFIFESVTSCIGTLPNTLCTGDRSGKRLLLDCGGKNGTTRDPIEPGHGGCMYLFFSKERKFYKRLDHPTNIFSYPLPNH